MAPKPMYLSRAGRLSERGAHERREKAPADGLLCWGLSIIGMRLCTSPALIFNPLPNRSHSPSRRFRSKASPPRRPYISLPAIFCVRSTTPPTTTSSSRATSPPHPRHLTVRNRSPLPPLHGRSADVDAPQHRRHRHQRSVHYLLRAPFLYLLGIRTFELLALSLRLFISEETWHWSYWARWALPPPGRLFFASFAFGRDPVAEYRAAGRRCGVPFAKWQGYPRGRGRRWGWSGFAIRAAVREFQDGFFNVDDECARRSAHHVLDSSKPEP
ncbi:hypothetical protein C8R45DRAFT_1107037 [Mycena sanguinolenta]|nr:hypothetical protein C8R45DRAFT_1107037 [Mycena sanguinolenta]